MKRIILIILFLILGLFTFSGCRQNSKIKLIENEDYFVRGEFTGKYLDLTKRGYYIDSYNQPNAPYLYIICMGVKNTGGYHLKIKKVQRDGEKTEILVEEIEPDKDSIVTTALTYPTIIVEFPEYVENIVIKNTVGEEYSKLKDY